MNVKPNRILVELTARCNFNCNYCEREWLNDYRKNDMDLDIFRFIVDTLPKSVKWLHPQGFGEPLLYEDIAWAVKYARVSGLKTKFFTNGSLMTEHMAHMLGFAGLTEIVFSIDDYDPTHINNRSPFSTDTFRLRDRIQKGAEILKRHGTKTIVRMTQTKENYKRIPASIEYWKNHVDTVAVSPEIVIATPDFYDFKKWSTTPKMKKTRPCENIYTQLMVRTDGTITVCCQDWFAYYPMGHIDDIEAPEDWTKMFNNADFKRVRKQLALGRKIPTICATCPAKGRTWNPCSQ